MIYDLVEFFGVLVSVVSVIFNGNWKKCCISVKFVEKVMWIVEEQGYVINCQVSMLCSKKLYVIGMIIFKYDNCYFGFIVECFEEMVCECGLLLIIICMCWCLELEIEVVKVMFFWQVDWVVVIGVINLDKIFVLCQQVGVLMVNFDLLGFFLLLVILDNYGGVKVLIYKILVNSVCCCGELVLLIFIGGCSSDYNISECLCGFYDVYCELGFSVLQVNILVFGYLKGYVEDCLQEWFGSEKMLLQGIFVNLMIFLEGVVCWLLQVGLIGSEQLLMGCFDWDFFVYLLGYDIDMVQQDVLVMLDVVFLIIDVGEVSQQWIEIFL